MPTPPPPHLAELYPITDELRQRLRRLLYDCGGDHARLARLLSGTYTPLGLAPLAECEQLVRDALTPTSTPTDA